MKKGIYIKLFLICFAMVSALSFIGLECQNANKEENEIVLNWWRVNFDDNGAMQTLADTYNAENPNVFVNIKTLTYTEYEDEILRALSASSATENKGPDILSIHNDWLPTWKERLVPMPEGTDDNPHMTLGEFQNRFVETVANELTDDYQIYAIPLYVDTLALYYNKDLFDSAGIASPPTNWREFSEDVQRLTIVNEGKIIQSGAAIGTSSNINRSTDLLELIMMQNGTQMISADRQNVTFNKTTLNANGNEYNPGETAINFYTDFANAQKEVYTWNLNQDYSIDAFVAGKTAMMFNYSFRQSTLQKKSGNLNYAIAPMVQVDPDRSKMNYPNYWGEAVSNKTLYPEQAWNFLEFLARQDISQTYLDLTGRPPAQRSLIENIDKTTAQGIFAQQALTARSWWKPDSRQTEVFFAKMIESINTGQSTISAAISQARQNIQQLISN